MSEGNVVAITVEAVRQRICKHCGKRIEFSRRAAQNWEAIEFCSAACRRTAGMTKAASKTVSKMPRPDRIA